MAKAVYITNNQRKNLFAVTQACSNNPARDQALLALVLGTPMKVIELSRLTVGDVLCEGLPRAVRAGVQWQVTTPIVGVKEVARISEYLLRLSDYHAPRHNNFVRCLLWARS